MIKFLNTHLSEFHERIGMKKIFPDFFLGLGLCLMICGAFFMDTAAHRLVMYVTILPALFFILSDNRFVSFVKEGNTLFIASLLFLSYACLSLAWSDDIDANRVWQKFKVLPFVVFFVIVYAQFFRIYPRMWQAFIEMFIFTAVVTGVCAIALHLPDFLRGREGDSVWRLTGFGRAFNSNQAGLLYGVALVCVAFISCPQAVLIRSRWCKYFCFVTIAMVFLLSVSRGSYFACIATVCGTLVLKLFVEKEKIKDAMLVIGSFLSLFVGLCVIYRDFIGYAVDRGTTGRFSIWEIAIDLYKDAPFFGVGIGTKIYYTVHDVVEITASHVHSLYLSTLLHLGAVGFLGFLVLCAMAVYRAAAYSMKYKNPLAFILILFGLAFGFVDFGGYYISLSNEWIVFWIPLAFLMSHTEKLTFKNDRGEFLRAGASGG